MVRATMYAYLHKNAAGCKHSIWCKGLCIKHSMCHNCDACGHVVLCQHSQSDSNNACRPTHVVFPHLPWILDQGVFLLAVFVPLLFQDSRSHDRTIHTYTTLFTSFPSVVISLVSLTLRRTYSLSPMRYLYTYIYLVRLASR